MPLDKVILTHLERQDEIEEKIEEEIEEMLNNLDINEIMTDSENVLLGLVEMIQERLEKVYYPQATFNGINLAKEIEDDGDIMIPKSKDPELNEDIVDAEGESQV